MSQDHGLDAPSVQRADDDLGERLRQLEAFTDATLAHLDLEQLLNELLARARQFLHADTAAVLMLDQASQQLVATVAHGIEEEVRQGVRIPLGSGFAGRVAVAKAPVAISHVDATTVFNPILISKGIRAMLGVPLLAYGEVLGVLHVGTLAPRHFTEHDSRLLQLVADRAALALRARLSERERSAARVLQSKLLPATLPHVPGLELAARYVPGDEGAIGGDWYDTFALPSGRLCLVVGDVMGHGLEAAHAMGRMRTALRAYALETEDPAHLLTKLDKQVTYFHPGLMATVLCAVLEPAHDRLTLSLAGHPPPVLAQPGLRSAHLLDSPADLPIGIPPAVTANTPPRRRTSIALPVGSSICCYTDGLIERRGHSLDDGLLKLTHAVESAPAETVCAKVMAELIGADTPEDDVAVLVLHRPGTPSDTRA